MKDPYRNLPPASHPTPLGGRAPVARILLGTGVAAAALIMCVSPAARAPILSTAPACDGGCSDAAVAFSTAPASELDDDPPYGNDVQRAVCGRRTPCHVLKVTPVDITADGRSLELVTVARFAAAPAEPWGSDEVQAEDGESSRPIPGDVDDVAEFEHWLVVHRGNTLVDRKWLVRDFEHGSAMLERRPLSGVQLTAGTLVYTPSWQGDSRRFRTHSSSTIDLEHLDVTRESGFSWDGLDGYTSESWDYDWMSRRLRRQHHQPNCAIPASIDDTGLRNRPLAFSVTWDEIPRIGEVNELSDTESIDACAPVFDGKSAGFVHGGQADRADASFRAVLLTGTGSGSDAGEASPLDKVKLVIDVTDDMLVPRDVVEVWTARDAGHLGIGGCDLDRPKDLEHAAGTAIRLATGEITRLAGEVPAGIRMTRSPDHVRVTVPLRVVHGELGDTFPALAIALRDSDDNATYERTISTTRNFHRKLAELAEPGPEIGCRRGPGGLARRGPRNTLSPLIGAADP